MWMYTQRNVCVLRKDFAMANMRPEGTADGDGDVNDNENDSCPAIPDCTYQILSHQADQTRSPARDGYHDSQHNPYGNDATYLHTLQ